jgi:hypothetical protein
MAISDLLVYAVKNHSRQPLADFSNLSYLLLFCNNVFMFYIKFLSHNDKTCADPKRRDHTAATLEMLLPREPATLPLQRRRGRELANRPAGVMLSSWRLRHHR